MSGDQRLRTPRPVDGEDTAPNDAGRPSSATRTTSTTTTATTTALRRGATALFALSVVVFNANLRNTASYDSLAASLLPFQILAGEGFTLDRFGTTTGVDVGYSMVESPRTGRWVSFYPVVTPLLALPLYLPSLLRDEWNLDDQITWGAVRLTWEKYAASVLAALAVVVLFRLLAREVAPRLAFALACVYAFATPLWSVASQGLWSHGPAQLLLATGLLLLAGLNPSAHALRLVALGVTCALLVANRPQMLTLGLALCFLALRALRPTPRRFLWLAAGGGSVATLAVAYNVYYFGTVLGGYGLPAMPNASLVHWRVPTLENVAILLAGNRGLLVFCPFLAVLAVMAWKHRGRWDRDARTVAFVWAAALVAFLGIHASYGSLGAGTTYGPRYLADTMPVLLLGIAAGWATLGGAARAGFWLAASLAFFLQVLGAFYYSGIRAGEDGIGAWNFRASGPVLSWIAGPATPHFPRSLPLYQMRQSVADDARFELRWQREPAKSIAKQELLGIRFTARHTGALDLSSIGDRFGWHDVRWLVVWERLGPSGAADHRASVVAHRDSYWMARQWRPGTSREIRLRLLAPSVPGHYRVTIQAAQNEQHVSTPLLAGGDGARIEAFVEVGAADGATPRTAGRGTTA